MSRTRTRLRLGVSVVLIVLILTLGMPDAGAAYSKYYYSTLDSPKLPPDQWRTSNTNDQVVREGGEVSIQDNFAQVTGGTVMDGSLYHSATALGNVTYTHAQVPGYSFCSQHGLFGNQDSRPISCLYYKTLSSK
jgi:hypothetical protein